MVAVAASWRTFRCGKRISRLCHSDTLCVFGYCVNSWEGGDWRSTGEGLPTQRPPKQTPATPSPLVAWSAPLISLPLGIPAYGRDHACDRLFCLEPSWLPAYQGSSA